MDSLGIRPKNVSANERAHPGRHAKNKGQRKVEVEEKYEDDGLLARARAMINIANRMSEQVNESLAASFGGIENRNSRLNNPVVSSQKDDAVYSEQAEHEETKDIEPVEDTFEDSLQADDNGFEDSLQVCNDEIFVPYMWIPLAVKGMVTNRASRIFFREDCREGNIPKIGQVIRMQGLTYNIEGVDSEDGLNVTLDKPIEKQKSKTSKDGFEKVFVKAELNEISPEQKTRARYCGSGRIYLRPSDENIKCKGGKRRESLERKAMLAEDIYSREYASQVARKCEMEKKAHLLQQKTKRRLQKLRQQEKQQRQKELQRLRDEEEQRKRTAEEKKRLALKAAKESGLRVLQRKRNKQLQSEQNEVEPVDSRVETSGIVGEEYQRLCKRRLRKAMALQKKQLEAKRQQEELQKDLARRKTQQRVENGIDTYNHEVALREESKRRRAKQARIAKQVEEQEKARYAQVERHRQRSRTREGLNREARPDVEISGDTQSPAMSLPVVPQKCGPISFVVKDVSSENHVIPETQSILTNDSNVDSPPSFNRQAKSILAPSTAHRSSFVSSVKVLQHPVDLSRTSGERVALKYRARAHQVDQATQNQKPPGSSSSYLMRI